MAVPYHAGTILVGKPATQGHAMNATSSLIIGVIVVAKRNRCRVEKEYSRTVVRMGWNGLECGSAMPFAIGPLIATYTTAAR